MKKKILFVVTSHDRLGNTNNPTGYYLSEVSHPWSVLISCLLYTSPSPRDTR